ncbi:MAG: Rhodococcus phage, partial [Actinomycetota bacterium]
MKNPTPRPRIPVYFNDHYCSPAIVFETFKKSESIATAIALNSDLSATLEVLDPARSTDDLGLATTEIERYVDEEYVQALKTGQPAHLAESNGLGWDKNLWSSVLHSTTGILRAIDEVASGAPFAASLSSGLHHATPSHGSGYCTINSVAVGALAAARGGLKVVILDLDAHCGGGTEAFLRKFPHEAE